MSDPPIPPPRAFTQGVGTVFQFTGVTIFLVFFFICCVSGLLSKETARDFTGPTWGNYTPQRAISVSMVVVIFLGMALAAIGLGLQSQNRRSPILAVIITAFGMAWWATHVIFFSYSIPLLLIAAILGLLFIALLILSIAALREMRRNPPPPDMEILPADYKVPYSHLHEDPPEVRLARELEQRRQKLAVQQKELEMLEEKLREKLKEKPGEGPSS